MNLITLNIDSIQLNQPLPFVLRGFNGVLLAQKGYVIGSRTELETLVARGAQLCVDIDESADSHRAYLAQLQRMLLSGQPLGEIASMQIQADTQPAPPARTVLQSDGPLDWHELQLSATQLLSTPHADDFRERFMALHQALASHSLQAPDATLLALVYLSAQETQMYSATHSMLVACVAMIVARTTLLWSEEQVRHTGYAALGMNLSMTELQDQLALQTEPLSSAQITAIETHAECSATLLQQRGIDDDVVLDAVRWHHHHAPGPLAQKTPAQQISRLLQRADVFAARIAPRAARMPMPITAAMQSCYYDERQQVDNAGAAIVKTLGIYPPGAFVRLASQEVGMVLKRGATATTPRIAVLLNRNDMPTGEMISRDTALPAWKITGAVAHHEMRVAISLKRLLAMV